MTCCKTINTIQQIYFPTQQNEQRFICESNGQDIEIIFHIYEHHLYYLTIHVSTNFLVYDPTRFNVFNRTENMFEMPIGEGYLLLKEWSYDIYDRDEIILSLNSITELI